MYEHTVHIQTDATSSMLQHRNPYRFDVIDREDITIVTFSCYGFDFSKLKKYGNILLLDQEKKVIGQVTP